MIKNEMKEITLKGARYSVVVRRKKIKNIYIRVDEAQNIVVSTNQYATTKQIEALIIKHQDKLLKIVHNKKKNLILPHQLVYLGKIYEMKMIGKNHFSYEINSDNITFYTPFSNVETRDLFYKEEAQHFLPERLRICFDHFCQFKPITFPLLQIRKMNCRYGTCYYAKNKIHLSIYLMKYDIKSIDYVIYHELTHFIHHNHSRDFYNYLGMIEPNHLLIKKNLNKY